VLVKDSYTSVKEADKQPVEVEYEEVNSDDDASESEENES
jgi:hypothetical protein